MKGWDNGTPFTFEKISPLAGLELGTARSVDQLNPLGYRGSFERIDCPLNFQKVKTNAETKRTVKSIGTETSEQIPHTQRSDCYFFRVHTVCKFTCMLWMHH